MSKLFWSAGSFYWVSHIDPFYSALAGVLDIRMKRIPDLLFRARVYREMKDNIANKYTEGMIRI